MEGAKITDNASRYIRETDPTLLRLRLIGQMEAKTLTGESVLPVGGKTRALLAILALADRKPVLRSRLAELLWSQRPEDMARASLRQEIHRLLDALSPLGVDVIDVQRHSLALKPVLTSVDAERLLTASVRTIDSVTLPDEPLLGELAGVDPALDEWLVQQRERLSAHLQQVYENAVRELTDPDQVEEMAERLLKTDGLNEIAWRARIQTAFHRGDPGRAAALADQMMQVFGDVEGYVLTPATQALIASIPTDTASRELVKDFPQAVLSTGSSETSFVAPLQRPDPMLALPVHYAAQHPSSAEPRKISLVFLVPSCTDGTLSDQGQRLRDQLELMFVNMGTFDILAIPEASLPDPANAPAVYRAWGTDYVISGNLRTGQDGADNRLILRVLDARRGGVIIWGTHYDFPSSGLDAAKNSILAPVQAMQWSIFVTEARRIAGRPDSELSALGMALRAFTLLLRHDCSLFGRIGSLLERAVDLEKEDGAIALIDGLYCYVRFLNEWSADTEAVFARGLRSVRAAILLMPDLHAVEILLAAYLMHDSASRSTAFSVAQTAVDAISRKDQNYEGSPDYLMAGIVLDLLRGEMKSAAGIVKVLLQNDCRSQLLELLRPAFMMVLLLGEAYQEVISMGRLMAGLYPSCPASLVYYLIALIEVDDFSEEACQVCRHLLRLVPDLTISKIISRFPLVEKPQQKRMAEALGKAGLARE
ncbi:AfsR/SARP family transcriptional regulator [Gluconobacter sp.]|uniref:AfsR/SARP family transcriptional regulator n=1 Tax=Gluconobacter sp. TaxID=1876758 RepID=UPI0039EAC55C